MIVPQPPPSSMVDDDMSDSSSAMGGMATPSSTATWTGSIQDQNTTSGEDSHPFRDARVSLAVDTSGSTAGPTIAAEQAFVKSIAQQLSPQSRLQGRILPWNSSAQRVQSLAHAGSLTSGGGTVSSVLLDDPNHRRTLAQSSLWFLMTDGLIHQRDRAQFALKLARAGLHGTSCVVVVFADPGAGQSGFGSAGNISVGVSVFAIVPNCAFLYYNIRNGEMRLLQAKGVFHCLFRGQSPPTFNGVADWSTFPRVTPGDFSDIVLPKPKRLDADEIALQGQQIVNMDDLFANKLRQEEVSRILSNEDNLASLIMTTQSRNQQHVFQGWIQQQRLQPADPAAAPRKDVDGAAQMAFRELLQAQQQGRRHERAPDLQAQIQQVHSANMQRFAQEFQQKLALAKQRDMLIRQAHARAGTSIDKASSLAPTWAYTAAGQPPSGPPPQLNHHHPYYHPMAIQPGRSVKPFEHPHSAEPQLQHLLYTPGFRSATGSFRGTCSICQGQNVTLSLMFRGGSGGSTATSGLPLSRRDDHANFPLALAYSSSFDALSSTICCDPCSSLCVKLGMSAESREKIVAALPLVRFSENRAAFQTTLSRAFEGRLAGETTPIVLLSVILMALDRPKVSPTFEEAVRWASLDLLHSIPTAWNAAKLDQSGPSSSLAIAIQQSLVALEGPLLLECPLDAFMVMLRAGDLLGTPLAMRRAAALRRFAYCITEGVVRERDTLLATGVPESQAIQKPFQGLLWRRDAATQDRLPILCTPPVLFDDVNIVPTHAFQVLGRSEEFKILLDPELYWPGHVLALFLRKLQKLLASEGRSHHSAQELFSELQRDEMVQRALRWPEQIREADVCPVQNDESNIL